MVHVELVEARFGVVCRSRNFSSVLGPIVAVLMLAVLAVTDAPVSVRVHQRELILPSRLYEFLNELKLSWGPYRVSQGLFCQHPVFVEIELQIQFGRRLSYRLSAPISALISAPFPLI